MTDTTTLAPTDAELFDFCSARIADDESVRTGDTRDHVDFARAVLAKWGAPAPASGEARMPLSDEQIFKAYTTATGKKLLKQGPARPGLLQIFRLAEAAHGITAAQKEAP